MFKTSSIINHSYRNSKDINRAWNLVKVWWYIAPHLLSAGLPRMVCVFVSTLSIPEGKQFFMVFNQASHHEKQRAKRPTSFSRLPRFHACRASNASLHTFEVVDG